MKLEIIKQKLSKMLIEFSTLKTDKAILEYNAEEIGVGVDVYITNENGERVAVEDGEYKTEDNKIITIKDGKVESIVEDVVEEIVEETKEEIVEDKIADEVLETETEQTEIEKLREEVNELYKLVDSILDKIGETRREADERFSKIEKMSIAKPAEEEIESTQKVEKTGDAKLDKMLARAKDLKRNWRE